MSRGYPSIERARKAYWRGAGAAGRAGARNPYANAKLADLWGRGRDRAAADPSLKIPARFGERHADKQRPPTQRPTRRNEPRDFDRGGGRGGW